MQQPISFNVFAAARAILAKKRRELAGLGDEPPLSDVTLKAVGEAPDRFNFSYITLPEMEAISSLFSFALNLQHKLHCSPEKPAPKVRVQYNVETHKGHIILPEHGSVAALEKIIKGVENMVNHAEKLSVANVAGMPPGEYKAIVVAAAYRDTAYYFIDNMMLSMVGKKAPLYPLERKDGAVMIALPAAAYEVLHTALGRSVA